MSAPLCRITLFPIAMALAGPAAAHHSFAMFDDTREVALAGTVKSFTWANPHVSLVLLTGTGPATAERDVEGSSVSVLVRNGWTRTTIQPGDKVIVYVHPYRDGRTGGELVRVKLPDGRTLGAGRPGS